MIRALLLCLACAGLFGYSKSSDGISEIPPCEDMAAGGIYLDLSSMDLRTINKPFAKSEKITCLNLAGNSIRNIASDAFDGLTDLHYLNLANNEISYDVLKSINLSKLESLVLDTVYPWDYDTDSYNRYLPQIPLHMARRHGKLKLSGLLREDPDFVLPNLEKLSLQNYDEGKHHLLRRVLQMIGMPHMTHLYLSGNGIEDPDLSRLLYNMNNITHLYLDGNRLRNVDGPYLQNVRHLSMNRNGIQALGTRDYYDGVYNTNSNQNILMTLRLNDLEYLSLTDNGIASIGSMFFESAGKMQILNLSGNKIEEFGSDVSIHLVNLRNLTMNNNLLNDVPDICALKELRSVSLSGNKISSINKASFCNLQYLNNISLKRNQLVDIPDEAFGHLPALQVLDMSHNWIVSLPALWIAPRNSIVELRLDGNEFEDIDNMSLKKIDDLKILSIGHNPFKMITILSLMDLPNSTRIDVSREAP